MIVKILGMIIGILVLAAGLYYLVKEKADPESRKIYTVISLIGAIVFVVALVLTILERKTPSPNNGEGVFYVWEQTKSLRWHERLWHKLQNGHKPLNGLWIVV